MIPSHCERARRIPDRKPTPSVTCGAIIFWRSRKQPCCITNVESEHPTIASDTQETLWLTQITLDFYVSVSLPKSF